MSSNTTTTDPLTKIENLERYACDTALSKEDRASIISDMNNRTRVLLGERVGLPATWCDRMCELESFYGIHKNKFSNNKKAPN